jgi:hypothetical protein
MTKRLPTILALAVAAFCAQACSSSSGTATGTGGAGGAVATATGGAGGGATATGGAPGDAGPTDAPADSGVSLSALCPAAPNMRNAMTTAMSAADFCAIYLATCEGANMPDGGYTALAACMTAYNGLQFDTTRECRSYHVCNAAVYGVAIAATHCGHSIGIGLCADVAVDAGPADTGSTDAAGQ